MEYLGAGLRAFFFDVDNGQRIGQAWFNNLDGKDRFRLAGSLADPFYADDWESVIMALEALLS